MATKTKSGIPAKGRGLPKPGENTFNGEENREAAEAFWAKFKTEHDDETLAAVLKFAVWARDAVGWRSFGRVITTGKAER
jgi:hypothetical protein